LFHRLKCPVANSVDFLNLVSSLKSLPNTFFGPTQEEQAILYAAIRLLLGNTSNDSENIREEITKNQEFNSKDDPIKAFQDKLIETVEALQNYCDALLKKEQKDKPEDIFDVRNILIALQEYCKKHNNNPDFDLNNALTVTRAALESDENLTKILANPYSVSAINFGENQGM
jgi:poly-D-alanine transfer protein DltD